MGNHLDFALKIAHRGNTGSHKGKRKLACLSENYICALLLFFSVFGLWHKANSVFTSPKFPPIFQNKNFDLQLFFFRVNITHHEGDFFCFVSCVLQGILKSKNQEMDWLCHPCRLRCPMRSKSCYQ